MRPHIIEAKGRIIVNSLKTGEISIAVDCGRGTMGAILTARQAAELSCAITAAIRAS